MAFQDEKYLLTNDTAAGLYEQVRELPIIDPHNHADVEEIWNNQNYEDLWQVEAATDHYVWEMLRKRGVPEAYITGERSNREKWNALAEVFEELAGNPTFEWIHLDLKRQLGIDELINAGTGDSIWQKAQQILQQDEMKPRALLKRMNVECMCSTDDPLDSLEFHKKLGEAPAMEGVVRPTFRPDKAMAIYKADWCDYINRLEARVGEKFQSIQDLLGALQITHDYFADFGCVASDHGVEVPYAYEVEETDANDAFRKAYAGKTLSEDEMIAFMSYMLAELAEMDAEKGWVFQLHIGAVRDMRDSLSSTLGPDSGGDISDHTIDLVAPLTPLLNRMDDRLKIVIYTLDPNMQSTAATICRAFGQNVNMGSAWWLNDSPIGMKRQLEYIGSVDLLWNFAGMVSDSRKLLSYYSRNEMFRRVLCDVVGGLVEKGQVPLPVAERLVRHLSYERPKELFGV